MAVSTVYNRFKAIRNWRTEVPNFADMKAIALSNDVSELVWVPQF